ncbi:DUF4410 domain-containing protein [Undibacterium piscinae]|uniref:DUF4410 domain-containing protein n=1 Tax=Undibacterium piscinae TaxID=2495591 RepID=A0A6M4A5W2_9BURK|nr:DUF4410 domain-containing protein [Undibacterium piscinae]
MLKSVKMALVAFSIILTGCAATVTKPTETKDSTANPPANVARLQIPAASAQKIVMIVKGSPAVSATSDWQAFREEWRAGMSAAALSKGLAFSLYEGDALPASETGTLIGVKINDYRYVSQGGRIFLGIMTGNAFLDADVEFIDLQSRRIVGTRKYNTTSSAWEGIFFAVTDKQVQLVSNEIVTEVINGRSGAGAVASSNNAIANYSTAPAATAAPAYSGSQTAMENIQTIEFRTGVSSVTVEKMANKAGCFGGKGAGLVTPKGVTEVYRMACDGGKNFVAKCEMRQCKVIR